MSLSRTDQMLEERSDLIEALREASIKALLLEFSAEGFDQETYDLAHEMQQNLRAMWRKIVDLASNG